MVGSDLFWKRLLALERSEIIGMGLGITREVKNTTLKAFAVLRMSDK